MTTKEYTANTPHEAWKHILNFFVFHGTVIGNCKTFDGIIVTEIRNPTDKVEKNPLYGQMFIDEYKTQFLNSDPKGFEYTYGERLCAYLTYDGIMCKVNQIDYIIRELKKDVNSRRAQAITWKPLFDTDCGDDDVEDVPCLQLVRCVVVHGRLNMEVVFRSHDMLKGYYPNVLGLSYLMDYIVKEVGGVTKGYLRVVSMSPHIYLSDRDVFKALTGGKL